MKKINVLVIVMTLGALIFSGCEQNEIMSYQEDYSAVNFTSDSTTYSFLENTDDEYIQKIPVRIVGDSAAQDRPFKVEVINDSLTTAEPDDYEIMDGIIEAGKFEDTLSVRLFNSEKLSEEKVSLHLRIVNSEDFKPGAVEDNTYLLTWTDRIVVPDWTWYRFFFCTNSSTTAYRVFVESTGRTSFTSDDYRGLGQYAAIALGRQFGDYIKQYNEDHPENPLIHEDGPAEGELIEPLYYTQSKFD